MGALRVGRAGSTHHGRCVDRTPHADPAAVALLLRPGASVATHAELRALGVPTSTTTHRCRPDGPWQRLLPGVVAGHWGTPTTHERRLAAVKYAGTGAALTGLDALDELGLPLHGVPVDQRVHVVVPHRCHRQSHGFALVVRAEHLGRVSERRGLPRVAAARAVVDASRRLDALDHVRSLVARAVQRRLCTTAELAAEVRIAARQRTAFLRMALREVQAGVRSGSEAKVRAVFARHGVPMPRWNAEVRDGDGDLVGVVDGLWDEEEVVLEIDSMEWHLDPASYERTQARHCRLVVAGMTVLAVAPGDVQRDPEQFCPQVTAVLAAARR